MKCSDCGVDNETVRLREASKVVRNNLDKRFGKEELGLRLNKHLCGQC